MVRRYINPNVKAQALELMRSGTMTQGEIGFKLGISSGTVANWAKAEKTNGHTTHVSLPMRSNLNATFLVSIRVSGEALSEVLNQYEIVSVSRE